MTTMTTKTTTSEKPFVVQLAAERWMALVKQRLIELTPDEERMARAASVLILDDWYLADPLNFSRTQTALEDDGWPLVAAMVEMARSVGKRRAIREH